MGLAKVLPPSIVKDESYTFDEGYSSNYYKFAQVLLSLPPLGIVEIDIDFKLKFGCCDGGLFNGFHPKMIVYVNNAAWKYVVISRT